MTEKTDRKHSPTPWRAMKTCTEPCILDANGKSVAACWNVTRMADANAVLIVEAVNAHERLVAEVARVRDALESLVAYCDAKGWNVCKELDRSVNDMVRAAIGEEAKDGND